MTLFEAKKIHCIGIGGIGISAIAKLLVFQGKKVTGSDAADSEIVQEAKVAGVEIMIGHRAENIANDVEAVIYSEAVPEDNPERVWAKEKGISEFAGAEALAELTRGKRLIAVTGTNGKSTTTAILGLLLEAGGMDPTVLVGSKVKHFPLGNVRPGKGEWFVLEADEYKAKFLNLEPEIAVVTNIETDHLDFFRDFKHIKEVYQEFFKRVKARLFLNADDLIMMNELKHSQETTTFGIQNLADYFIEDTSIKDSKQIFEIRGHGEFKISLPGRFNVMNATAALAVALELGVPEDICRKTLEEFPGIWRRFERVGEKNGALIVSDYAHHPTAVSLTIIGAKRFYPRRRLVIVFQPHHTHRLEALFDDFAKSFKGADVVVICETYFVRGREEIKVTKTAKDLADAISNPNNKVFYGENLEKTGQIVREQIKEGDVVIFMGAGDIDSLARGLIK